MDAYERELARLEAESTAAAKALADHERPIPAARGHDPIPTTNRDAEWHAKRDELRQARDDAKAAVKEWYNSIRGG